MVRATGLNVDDDNDPAPENIPYSTVITVDGVKWGWNGANLRSMFGATDDAPRMNTLKGLSLKIVTCTIMFLTFFPQTFFEDVILAQTNKQLDHEWTFGEFLRWIGVWFIISKNSPGNINKREFWSAKPPSRECGAPFRLSDIMSGCRFEEIC